MPALSVRLAKPAGRVVYIGLSSTPSLVDTRDIALKDITAVGILSASPGLAGAIEHFADGSVVPDAIVSEVVALEDVPARLEGRRGAGCRARPEGARRPATGRVMTGADHDRATAASRRREEKLVGADRVIAVLTELADHPLGVTLDELAGMLRSSEADRAPRAGDAAPRGAGRHGRARRVRPRRRVPPTRVPQPRRPARDRPHPAAARAARRPVRRDGALRRALRHGHRLPREDGSAAGRRAAHVGDRRPQSRLPHRRRQGAAEQPAARPRPGDGLVRRLPARAEDPAHPDHARSAPRGAAGDPRARLRDRRRGERARHQLRRGARSTSTGRPRRPVPSASARCRFRCPVETLVEGVPAIRKTIVDKLGPAALG